MKRKRGNENRWKVALLNQTQDVLMQNLTLEQAKFNT